MYTCCAGDVHGYVCVVPVQISVIPKKLYKSQ